MTRPAGQVIWQGAGASFRQSPPAQLWVSMWLTNHLLAENDIEVEVEKLIKGLVACQSPMILVSNEVGLGGIEVNSLARRFATHQGRLNQRLAELAGTVHLVTSGLPIALKGSL